MVNNKRQNAQQDSVQWFSDCVLTIEEVLQIHGIRHDDSSETNNRRTNIRVEQTSMQYEI